ncbi:MAG: hypothetical protein AAGK78_16190, partial [Planctomycetota bacterium]
MLALSTYAALAGCVVMHSSRQASPEPVSPSMSSPMLSAKPAAQETAADDAFTLPIRAVGMQLQRTDWIDKYKESIDEVADLGADAVKIVVDARQEDGTSNRIYLDLRMTPTPDQLSEVIAHAKSRGLRVILMPIVLLDDPKGGEWRGTLRPESWDDWFDSYREILGHFLWIAEGNGVDLFVIGSELLSSEQQRRQWDQTIRFVRERYSGLITYSSNWDHYHNVPFWNRLDLIGMNSYWTLGKDGEATVDEIKSNWADIAAGLEPFVKRQGKPLIFLEIGWTSLDNAASEPWDYTKPLPTNLALQERLYTAFFETWHGKSWLGGFSVWEWPPGDGG